MIKDNKNSAKQNKDEEIADEQVIADEEIVDSAEQNIEESAASAESFVDPREDDEVEKLTNQLKRALADYQNLEKRISGEKAAWIMSANKDLIMRLLPGLDSLLLAEKHTEDQGVKMSIKHFMDTLEAEGVKKIETTDADFDPHLMEAVTTQEGKEGVVVEEVKAGYTLNSDVIRPAQVIVGRKS